MTFGSFRSTCSRSWGRSLHAQPMPWVYRVSRTSSPVVSTGAAAAAGRSRRTASATIRTASSTSASVVPRPTEKRTVPIA